MQPTFEIERRRIIRACACAGFGFCFIALLCEPACAIGTILNTGFDTYANGALAGQSGWVADGAGSSSAEVQTAISLSSSKAVKVTRAANTNGDQRWATPVSGYPTQRFITVDWDMRVTQTTPVAYGPFFGVDTYDANPSSTPCVLGSLGVDATTGDVLYQEQNTGVIRESGQFVSFDTWNHFRIILDFGTDTYNGYVNGNLAVSTGFVDGGHNLNDFTDADIATFAAAGDTQSLAMPGIAYFDNFVIRDGLMGDYDIEGDVDDDDYVVWRKNFGATIATPGNSADGNKNGLVDAADYVAWRKSLGTSLFPPGGSGGSPVPEPASALTLLALVSIFFQASGRRRSG
jgi:hypothetical protein